MCVCMCVGGGVIRGATSVLEEREYPEATCEAAVYVLHD